MSVEVKNNRSKLAAEWNNIGKLYRIHLRQEKIIVFYIITAVFMLAASLAILLLEKESSSEMNYIQGMSSGLTLIITIYVLICSGTTSNILTNPSISIYPGTVKTRFIARVLYDVSKIAFGVCNGMLWNLAGIGIYKLLGSTGKYVYNELMFDGKTFLMRSALWLCYLLLVYFVFVLLHVIGTRIGDKAMLFVCCIAAIAVILIWQLGYYSIFLKVNAFYKGANLGFGTAICRILVTTAILFILACLVMSTVHSWHENSKVQMGITIGLVYIVVIFGTITLTFEEKTSEREYFTTTLEEDIAESKVIVNDRIIKPGKVDAVKLNDNYETAKPESEYYESFMDMGFSVGWCEYEKAKEAGLIGQNETFGEGEMLVRVVAPNDWYGDDLVIFDKFISELGVDIKDSRYVLTFPERVLLYDDFLTSMDSILGSQAVTVPTEIQELINGTLSACQVYIIYHAEDMISSEEIMSYDVCDTSHTWYLPEDEDVYQYDEEEYEDEE